jgi:hypothetical protein
MATDYTQSEIDIVIDLIRGDNSEKVLTSSQITFGNPSVFTPTAQIDRNSLIVATSVEGGGYTGSQSFYYDRVALQDFVFTGTTSLDFTITTETLLSDLLPALNSRLNTNIDVSKIVDKTLPSTADGSTQTVQLSIVSTSMVYMGDLVLTLVPNDVPLSNVITTTDLDGLTYAAPVAQVN